MTSPLPPPTTANVRRATHLGLLRITELVVPCAVLEDGTRLVSHRGVADVLGRARGGKSTAIEDGDLPAVFAPSNLTKGNDSHPFRMENFVPIAYRDPRGGRIAMGLRAELLPEICELWLRARDEGLLRANQVHTAARADLLMRGFARTGVIALVDEATGYQRDRALGELQTILERYIAKELLPWTKRFPDDFFAQTFRLHKWRFVPGSVRRPRCVGTFINRVVYERLPPGVLEDLQRVNPAVAGRRRHKHHQLLTVDIGNAHLERHLTGVIALMRASSALPRFLTLLDRVYPHLGTQLPLPVVDDEPEPA
jgi:hypothetical protein